MRARTASGVPGTIYLNGGRCWWKVKPPGETEAKARPPQPVGAQFATDDRGYALAWVRPLRL